MRTTKATKTAKNTKAKKVVKSTGRSKMEKKSKSKNLATYKSAYGVVSCYNDEKLAELFDIGFAKFAQEHEITSYEINVDRLPNKPICLMVEVSGLANCPPVDKFRKEDFDDTDISVVIDGKEKTEAFFKLNKKQCVVLNSMDYFIGFDLIKN